MNPFVRFGPEHLGTVAFLTLVALALAALAARLVRRASRAAPVVRLGLAGILVAAAVVALGDALPIRRIDWIEALPLDLCDLAVVIAIAALVTRQQLAYELLYFWGLTGTLIATITPDVAVGFPDTRCVSFFGLHGMVVASALVLTLGYGMRPRPRANWRAFLLLNAYAVVVGLVDVAWDRNYMYLRAKPSEPSLLDVLGPWPWYLVSADVVALALFWLLMLPYRAGARAPASASDFPKT
ncbi:MAG: TIGR02206 family membrane protein [Hyphomicrobiales bacterium]